MIMVFSRYAKNSEKAYSYYQEMRPRKIQPNIQTFELLYEMLNTYNIQSGFSE